MVYVENKCQSLLTCANFPAVIYFCKSLLIYIDRVSLKSHRPTPRMIPETISHDPRSLYELVNPRLPSVPPPIFSLSFVINMGYARNNSQIYSRFITIFSIFSLFSCALHPSISVSYAERIPPSVCSPVMMICTFIPPAFILPPFKGRFLVFPYDFLLIPLPWDPAFPSPPLSLAARHMKKDSYEAEASFIIVYFPWHAWTKPCMHVWREETE